MDTGKLTQLFPNSPEGSKTVRQWMIDHRGHSKRRGVVLDTLTGDSYNLFYCVECEQFYVADKLVSAN